MATSPAGTAPTGPCWPASPDADEFCDGTMWCVTGQIAIDQAIEAFLDQHRAQL